MSVDCHVLLREAAVRLNALTGALPADLETTYSTLPLTSANFQSSVFPFTSFLDQMTASIARFAEAIASTPDHPYRAYLLSQTAALASGASMPSVDVAGDPIIGIYGKVLDGVDGTTCTGYPEQVIRRRLKNSSAWIVPVYGFNTSGDGIIHTRSTVVVQVCVFNWDTTYTLVSTNGVFPLPDSLANAVVYDMVGAMIRDDEFIPQANQYRSIADSVEAQIRQGRAIVVQQSIPLPVSVAA